MHSPEPVNPPDHQLALEIAAAILLDGVYVVVLDLARREHIAQLRSAAREAGRLFGFSVETHLLERQRREQSTATLTITRADTADLAGASRARGIEVLLDALDRDHLRLVHSQDDPEDDADRSH